MKRLQIVVYVIIGTLVLTGLSSCDNPISVEDIAINSPFTISFDGNGADGGGPVADITGLEPGDTGTLPANTYSRTGYTFMGWTTEPYAGGQYYPDGSSYKVGSGDVTMYAWWVGDPAVMSLEKRELVSVPGGTFTQGPSNYYWSSDAFTHTISDFSLGKYEVTYELWYYVREWAINTTGNYTIYNGVPIVGEGHDGTEGDPPVGFEPATGANWYAAIVWCNAYSELMGYEPVYYEGGTTNVLRSTTDAQSNSYEVDWSANGFRLPTEGEWEYAARYQNGQNWTDPKWASGAAGESESAIKEVAWYSKNADSGSWTEPHADDEGTQTVGTRAPNQLGIYDMSGNVEEWCWDWNASYPSDPQTDYRGPDSPATYRILRGGDWNDSSDYVRVGRRKGDTPSNTSGYRGLRIARNVQ